MGGVARRLNRQRLALQPVRERALRFEPVEDGIKMGSKTGVERHRSGPKLEECGGLAKGWGKGQKEPLSLREITLPSQKSSQRLSVRLPSLRERKDPICDCAIVEEEFHSDSKCAGTGVMARHKKGYN